MGTMIRVLSILTLFAVLTGESFSADRHWVGNGTGNGRFWNQAANWSATQGGAGGAGVPTASDDVFISGGGRTEVNTNAVCLSFTQNHAGHLTDFRTATTLTVGAGGFSLTDGTFNTDVSNTVNVAGNFSVTGGSFVPGTGRILLNGSGPQTVTTNVAFYNLTFDNAAGFTLATNVVVNNTLALVAGVVQTGANDLSVASTGTVSRTAGHVFGSLTRNVATGATTRRFDVGGPSVYSPVSITFGNVTTAGNLTATSTDGDHPNILSSSIHPALGANRYWTMTNGGVGFDNYAAVFTFSPGDLDPGANTASFIARRYASGSWFAATVGSRTGTSTEVTGQTTFGDFAVGNSTVAYTITASASAGGSISPSGAVSVNYGNNQSLTVTPNTGYHIDSVVVDGVNQGAVASYDFTNVTANHTIAAYFSIDVFTVTASASAGGSISPSGSVSVNYGADRSFTVTPNTGYHIDSVVVDGVNQGAVASYDFTNVTANHTIAAYFSIDVFTITASSSAGGSISPSGAISVNYGGNQSFALTPNTGYHIDSVVVDGVNQGAVASYDFTSVTANHTIAAYFSIDVFAINASASAGGSITPSGSLSVDYGADQPFAVTPNTGYHVDSVVVDGVNQGAVASYDFTNVTANHTIAAYFSIDVFTITASASSGGSISPSGSIDVGYGGNQSFAITPDPNYHIDSVVVDGVNQGALSSYDFNAIAANHAIAAYFSIDVFTVTASASAGGSISPSGSVSVNYGADRSFTVTPNTGYHIDSVVVDGVNQGAVAGYDFTTVSANHSIAAYFSIDMYVIAAGGNAGGTVSPSGLVPVSHGSDQSFTITPATGYYIADVHADTTSLGAVGSYTFTNVTENHALNATFALQTFPITAVAGPNGSISPAGVTVAGYGSSQGYTITPATGYFIADVHVDSVSVGPVASWTFNNVTAPHLIEATFAIRTFSLNGVAGPNGTISPSGVTTAAYGDTVTYTITPATGYFIADVHVDSVSVGAVGTYAFNGVTADHLVEATFALQQFTITASASAGGTISPSGGVTAGYGSTRSFTVAANPGYHLDSVVVDGANQGAVPGYDFTNVTANHAIAAYFSINLYPIVATAGAGGTINPSGTVQVAHGANQSFTITPATGYSIVDVHVDTVSVGAVGAYSFTGVTGPHTISATFALRTFTLTALAGPNGSISPAGATVADYGDTVTYTITPNTGYFIADVHVDSVSVGPVGTYAFNGVTANHLIEATFSLSQYTIVASAGFGGTISPSGAVGASHGDTRVFTMTPNPGYHLDSVRVDGVNVGAPLSYSFTNITANHAIAAYYSINVYSIAAVAGAGGGISPSGIVPVPHGADQSFTITPATGYFIADVHVDTVSVGAVANYTFTNVTSNHLITATFARQTFTIAAIAGPNGSVSPAGTTTVSYGDTLTVSVTPDPGYFVVDVTVDSVSVGAVSSYTFFGVTANHLLQAAFGTNALPTAPALASPLDGDTVGEGSLTAMPFAWSASTDADAGDTLRYTVRILGPGVDFTSPSTTDTGVTLDLSAELAANNDYSWTVLVSDGQATVASADTFRFHVSPFTGVADGDVLPKAYALGQNYPNPFNPVTAIPFDLPERSTVTLKVYNILGVEVMSLVSDESLPAGFHTRSVDFNGLASGAYFYQLTARGESGQAFDRVMKMMVIR